MNRMVSSAEGKRVRKSPVERRAEIVAAAAAIGLDEGLECITLRRVAEELGVRPGLIGHYFPVAEDLVSEAFASAAAGERDDLLPPGDEGADPLERMRRLIARLDETSPSPLDRLWLNARHLSRLRPALEGAVAHEEETTMRRLTELIADGVEAGEFSCPDGDAAGAAIRILVAIDGLGSYANSATPFTHPIMRALVRETAERALGLKPGALG